MKPTQHTSTDDRTSGPRGVAGLPASPEVSSALSHQNSVQSVSAAFRNIWLVVFLILVFATVQTFILWRVCDAGMKTAASLEHEGLPTLSTLASLQEDLAIYRLHSYEYLFASEESRAATANGVTVVGERMRAELNRLEVLLPDGEGRRLVSRLANSFDVLNTGFRKVRDLVDADFPAAMKAMDQDIPPLTERVSAAAADLVSYGYQFSGRQASATFGSFGWIKKNAVMFGSANILVAFGAVVFVLLAARRSRAQLSASLTRLDERTQELARSLSLVGATLEATADGILATDGKGRVTSFNENFLTIWKIPPELRQTANEAALLEIAMGQLKEPEQFHAKVQELYRNLKDSFDVLELNDGRVFERFARPQRIGEKFVGCVWSFRDITERRRAEAELKSTHRQLLDASRQAGMAEIATGVLHNVGNVLNSVNVSMEVAAKKVRQLKVASLGKVAALVQEHAGDPAAFFANPQGAKLPAFLGELAEHFIAEQAALLDELGSLKGDVEHINEIVAMQQSYAGAGGMTETLAVADVIEDALRMNAAALDRHGALVVREFDPALPAVPIDRHKLLQILVNLIRNAKYAMDEPGAAGKQLTVRTERNGVSFKVSVSDMGIGIDRENLTRIFSHGFTTKKEGHGFGLHSSANAATEMGGRLSVHSDGLGCGATFTVELPLSRVEASPASLQNA